MEHICLIIDFDGFELSRGRFANRETAYVAMEYDVCEVMSFDLSEIPIYIQGDIETIHYCKKFIHGLQFLPKPNECAYHPDFLNEYLNYLHSSYATQSKYFIAYNGGRFEKEKLQELNLPSINLETYGCPKYDYLRQYYGDPEKPETCDLHEQSLDKVYHCALAEVKMLKRWVSEKLLEETIRGKLAEK